MAKIISIKNHVSCVEQGRFSIIKEYYRFVPGSNGRKLNSQDSQVFDLLADLTKGGEPAHLDYDWLQGRMHCSKKTIYRMLKKLSNLFDVELIRGKRPINGRYEQNKLQITRTANFEVIISEAISSLKSRAAESSSAKNCRELTTKVYQKEDQVDTESVVNLHQKCRELRTEVESIYISNKNKKDTQENSSSCNKSRAREKEEEKTTFEEEDEFIPFAFDAKAENSPANQKEEEEKQKQTEEKLEEAPQEAKKESAEKELSESDLSLAFNYQLSQNLSLATFMLLSKNFTFSYSKAQSKLSITLSALPLSALTDSEKEVIRKAASSVYGEGVKLTVRKGEAEKTKLGTGYRTSNTPPLKQENEPAEWREVLSLLSKSLGSSLVNCWFGKLEVSFNAEEKKFLLSGGSFTVCWIINNYKQQLEQALKASEYTSELFYQQNGEVTCHKLPEAAFVKAKAIEGDFDLSEIFKQMNMKPMEEKMQQVN